MSIKYNIIQRGEPGVTGGGTKKFYLTTKRDRLVDLDELTDEVTALSTVNGADVSAVLYGLVEIVIKMIKQGHTVELGKLGFLRASISSTGSDTEEEATPANITARRVIYRPGSKIKDMLNTLKFTKE